MRANLSFFKKSLEYPYFHPEHQHHFFSSCREIMLIRYKSGGLTKIVYFGINWINIIQDHLELEREAFIEIMVGVCGALISRQEITSKHPASNRSYTGRHIPKCI